MEIVEQEIDRKLDTGQATLTDMISVQDRITSVRLGLVRSLNNYASSLADLRYLSGTMINKNEGCMNSHPTMCLSCLLMS